MARFEHMNLNGLQVRLVNGDIVTVNNRNEFTKLRGEGYDSRCGTHMFDLQGSSLIRDKYNITKITTQSLATRDPETQYWVVRGRDSDDIIVTEKYSHDLESRFENLAFVK